MAPRNSVDDHCFEDGPSRKECWLLLHFATCDDTIFAVAAALRDDIFAA